MTIVYGTLIGPTGSGSMKQTEAPKLMDLAQILETVAVGLRSGELDNEAQVKQSVILPILRALDWDDTDYKSFKPEYSVDSGRVDYALLDRRLGKPLVFIEAKQLGNLDARGEEQLFRYASNRGVPLLVLTDGDRWDFYLSMAEGDPPERRFYRLELQLDHKLPEYADFLEKHLRKDRVVSGQAKRDAEHRHASNRERERARRAIPDAWQSLLKDPDEVLRDLLAEKVESECGTKPELDDVDKFLRNRSLLAPAPNGPRPPRPLTPPPPVRPAGVPETSPAARVKTAKHKPKTPAKYQGRWVRALRMTNPRRHGTHGSFSYSIILDAHNNEMLIEDFVKQGGRIQDLEWDLGKEYVALSDAPSFGGQLEDPKPIPLVEPLRPGPSQPAQTKPVGFVLRGERVETGNAIKTLIALVERLARQNPAFMERFASETASKNRNLVSRNRTDLYLKFPHLIKNSQKLENGWWLGKNLSAQGVRKYIETACQVAGVKFGAELTLIEK